MENKNKAMLLMIMSFAVMYLALEISPLCVILALPVGFYAGGFDQQLFNKRLIEMWGGGQ